MAMVANQPPRARYAAAMVVASAVGIACAYLVAHAMGGGRDVAVQAAAVVAGAAVVGFIPALIGTAQHFGVAVLVASLSRLLIVLIAGLVLTQIGHAPKRPLWLGAVSGAVVILIAESAVSIAVIAAMDRLRSASASDRSNQTSPGFQESPGSC